MRRSGFQYITKMIYILTLTLLIGSSACRLANVNGESSLADNSAKSEKTRAGKTESANNTRAPNTPTETTVNVNKEINTVNNKPQTQKGSKNKTEPFIQYDSDGIPNAIVNMMARKGDRVGCEDKTETITGEVVEIEKYSEKAYEITIETAKKKRRNIVVGIAEKDKIDPDDLQSIIAEGSLLTINYILCGNGGHPTPIDIYKQ